jgi:hypothetical protein
LFSAADLVLKKIAMPSYILIPEKFISASFLLVWDSFAPVNFRDENPELVMGLSATSPFPYYDIQARTSGSMARDLVINPLSGDVIVNKLSSTGGLVVSNLGGSGVVRVCAYNTGDLCKNGIDAGCAC